MRSRLAPLEIVPLGDSALIIRVRVDFESDPEGCLRAVSAVLRRLQRANLRGVLDVAPAFTSVSVFYDPAKVAASGAPDDKIYEWLESKVRALVDVSLHKKSAAPEPRSVEIPVCYDAEFAPDLDVVAVRANMTAADVVAAHSAATYHVGCIGFAPGFPYLTGLPPALATRRRTTPRTQVAAGSVAIGGAQTGIYPQSSPGGWNIIGRTPQRLFDHRREPPSFLAMGDAVRFRRITRSEFEALSE